MDKYSLHSDVCVCVFFSLFLSFLNVKSIKALDVSDFHFSISSLNWWKCFLVISKMYIKC